MSTYYPSETRRRYDPGAAVHEVHSCNIFLPRGQEPLGGWPVLITSALSGFATSQERASIVEGLQQMHWELLEAGIAIMWCVFPPTRAGTVASPHGTLPPADATTFNPGAGTYGAPYALGCGAVVGHIGVVGDTWPGSNPPGWAGTHPWLDPDFVMPEKAACYAIQHARYYSRQNRPDDANGLPFNRDLICVDGSSAAAIAFCFPVFMPDMAGELGSHAQDQMSTRVKFARLSECAFDWQLMATDGSGEFKGYHWPRSSDTTYETPCEDVIVGTGGTVTQWLLQMSPLYYGTDRGSAWENDDTKDNEFVWIYTSYDEPSDMDLTIKDRWVYNYGAQQFEVTTHPISQGYALGAVYPDRLTFVAWDLAAVDPRAHIDGGSVRADTLLTDLNGRYSHAAAWIISKLQAEAALPHTRGPVTNTYAAVDAFAAGVTQVAWAGEGKTSTCVRHSNFANANSRLWVSGGSKPAASLKGSVLTSPSIIGPDHSPVIINGDCDVWIYSEDAANKANATVQRHY